MAIKHYDLFAGIGGFSLALEEVFTNEEIKHIFCEWESFPTAVLRQHWPAGEFWGDIAELVAYTERARLEGSRQEATGHGGQSDRERSNEEQDWSIVTGGFPCQPFSHAGRRKGTADDRYQWPNMFAVIRDVKPRWVIAENVRGLVTWNEGLVLETVCSDLEGEGYEVQPFIIPAVAVGAPHRRDRVWIIAHAKDERRQPEVGLERKSDAQATEHSDADRNATDTTGKRDGGSAGEERGTSQRIVEQEERQGSPVRSESEGRSRDFERQEWNRDWREVAFATCDDSMDDGLPRLVDGVPYSRAKWRRDSIKAYGNGIVHQVATQIMKGIREAECTTGK